MKAEQIPASELPGFIPGFVRPCSCHDMFKKERVAATGGLQGNVLATSKPQRGEKDQNANSEGPL